MIPISFLNEGHPLIFQKKIESPYLPAVRGVRYQVQRVVKHPATCKTKLKMLVPLFLHERG